jgi:HAMP domain-containing protein
MRIRSQLFALLGLAAVIGALLLGAMLVAARAQWMLGQSMARAQAISHEVSGLLVLTQEYALHGDARAAQQWLQRHRAIGDELDAEAAAYRGNPSFEQLRGLAKALPEVFARWQTVRSDSSPFAARRREMLLDQIVTSTQAMSDHAHQWYADVAARRGHAERVFMGLSLLMALVFGGLLAWLAGSMRRRVLRPLKGLESAARAFGRGESGVRLNSARNDELGELARSFDGMAALIEQRGTALDSAERQLRVVTDNLPVLIAYLDRDRVCRFVNAHFGRVCGPVAETFLGRTIDDALGAAAWAPLRVPFAAALDGERRRCEWRLVGRGQSHLLEAEFIPDPGPEGRVQGVYLMAGEAGARRVAQEAGETLPADRTSP